MKKLIALLLVAVSLHVHAADQAEPLPIQECTAQAPYGFPSTDKQSVTPICRKAYYVVYDNNAKIPVFVSYVLTPAHAVGCLARSNAFATDMSLPAEIAATPHDYAKSGYDIGHQANSSDMRWDNEVERESFILSNMAPQLPEFNRGIWKKLEDTTRGWVISRQHPVLIYVGPVYTRAQDPTIGVGFVTVPHGFFKILVDTETNEVQVFLFRHEGSKEPLSSFITSLANVQRLTGVKFPLPDKPVWNGLWPIELKSNRAAKNFACSIN